MRTIDSTRWLQDRMCSRRYPLTSNNVDTIGRTMKIISTVSLLSTSFAHGQQSAATQRRNNRSVAPYAAAIELVGMIFDFQGSLELLLRLS
jgi:hypothetical protein